MGTADLHLHTALGDGMAELPELLAYVQEHTDLSAIAITEHDTLEPALEARELHARGRYRFQVILGEEVTTIEGHLLALFVEEPVPSLKPLAPTLEAVHRQGGLAVIPHPMSWLTRSLGQRTIERVLRDGGRFDGIEAASSPAGRLTGEKARRLNRERYHLAEVGGSDAHFLEAVGVSRTIFPGDSTGELKQAILDRTTSVAEDRYPSVREVGVGRFLRQQWRGFTATPRQMGWLPTIGSFLKRARP